MRSIVFAFALVGCASPTTGEYLFEEVSTTTDCPEVEDTGGEPAENEPVAVKVSDEGDSVSIGGFDCPLDGNTFTCEYEPTVVDYSTFGTDLVAVATFTAGSTGTWVSSSKISGTSESSSTCEGADCATTESDYGAVYCTTTTEYEGLLQDE
ncbi:MAG: hypothetical protein Q8P41_29695 [Pseudomonadota bacterium]|nr:hypothetical protein [Pseudomonadota bacterium]